MKPYTRYILLAACQLLAGLAALQAQTGIYIPQSGKVFFSKDTATIFSNVINQGNIGIGKNAVINFKGKVWENDSKAHITNETDPINGTAGQSGILRFIADSFRQKLNGGYNAAIKAGPMFSRLYIKNKLGVELTGSSAKVANEIMLQEGLVYLRDQILIVGNNHPGQITGYDPTHYFVTGNKPGSGLLLRENIRSSDGLIVFPIGSKENAYTPAGIRMKSPTGDDFYVNVFDGVYSSLLTGSDISAQGVNKTWQVGKLQRPNTDEVEVVLQHLNSDEGSTFTRQKNNAYIARYTNSGWDIGSPQNYPVPGNLTSGTALPNSGINMRLFNGTIANSSYLTKLTGPGDSLLKTDLVLYGHRKNRVETKVEWETHPEVNVQYFVVQRKLSNETQFRNVDTVASLATNGISTANLYYNIIDPNDYTGISFYRLQLMQYNGDTSYTPAIAIAGRWGQFNAIVWPNPSHGNFFVGMSMTIPVKSIVVWNALGQKIRVEPANGRTLIELKGFIPGTYFVGVISSVGATLDVKKVVVVGN